MARFALNNQKANNYAFFCPVSRLHLTRSNPIGSTNGVTPAIVRGLRSKVILDVDGAVDIDKGVLKEVLASTPTPPELQPSTEGQHEEDSQGDGRKRRGRQKKNEANPDSQPTEPSEPAADTEGNGQAEE